MERASTNIGNADRVRAILKTDPSKPNTCFATAHRPSQRVVI